MAWSHVQDTPGSNALSGAVASSLSIGAFGSAVVIGNFVVVFTAGENASNPPTAGQITCSDNATTPNTYTQIAFKGGHYSVQNGLWAAIFVAKIASNPASGNINPKVTFGGTSPHGIACAAEFCGGTVATDGSSGNTAANTTATPTCGTMSTAANADLLLACFGMAQASNLTSITTPPNYTSVGVGTSETVEAGQGCYYIPPGTVTSNNPSWAILGGSGGAGDGWVAVQAALKSAMNPWLPIPSLPPAMLGM